MIYVVGSPRLATAILLSHGWVGDPEAVTALNLRAFDGVNPEGARVILAADWSQCIGIGGRAVLERRGFKIEVDE